MTSATSAAVPATPPVSGMSPFGNVTALPLPVCFGLRVVVDFCLDGPWTDSVDADPMTPNSTASCWTMATCPAFVAA